MSMCETRKNKLLHFSFLKSINTVILISFALSLILTGVVVLIFNTQNKLDSEGIFYYNSPLDKGSAIDTTDILSPDFFWDRNNVFNKFTLGEIDFDENGTTIDIVNSSKL